MLTDTRIRNARKAKKPYKLTDAGGLYIEIRPSGAKLWRYRYRIAGKEYLFALGEYPDKRLAEARTARDDARKLVKQGIHPLQQKRLEAIQKAHEGRNTFEAIAQDWIKQNTPHWTANTRLQREKLLSREVYPHIGRLPIRQVTPAHVLAILKRLEKKAPSFAIIARQAMDATFRLAISTLRAEANPVPALKGSIKAPPTVHKTPLKEAEIPAFMKALEGYSGSFQTKVAIRLLWLTLARTNEMLGARWSEFDLERALWTVPAERMKMRREHRVPLSAQAVELLKRLHGVTCNSEFLFPHRGDLRQPMNQGALWRAISIFGYSGRFSPHAIRTTGSTLLNEMGFPADWIEQQLAHVPGNKTRASYNRSDYLDQRRDMMQQWAAYLDDLSAGRKVVPIRKQA